MGLNLALIRLSLITISKSFVSSTTSGGGGAQLIYLGQN